MGFFGSRSGRSLFNGLLLDDLKPPLVDIGKRLILLRLNADIHLLIEFGCHLYKKNSLSFQ